MCLGIPGQIVEVTDAANDLALVNVGGVRRVINIAFVIGEGRTANSCIGEWVLVHVGFAMSRLDEQEAARTLALLHELGVAQGEMNDIAGMGELRDELRDELREELRSAP
ncbi:MULTISPECIES: HypC/HybG/HupF family hydrogenase formation chaperone [Paraburkholderia]|jgi:hydrogenase expression/formation protein HypC|uniref:HypC/HybG/HupF family hydrogenase formation chaperone n=1 Tax=Paraburkholderia madseniana TaxID=2599607 RepID=A0A6N6W5W4_9BURK|nr:MULTISPECIES: HypC/HybG/HupF family hydrogenase formation chaperone [Paraburkholderia]KAE8755803.1 HypC/HybG/HupF family hydrogenase formation chaperone [Paraburkholderia madseniana]MCX4174850.1 HypC/HybG/HupF family hydrogenase formation chaperone [Paraburkholderia madseniana]MDQ6462851.1 HypC/HybG/HupF family hydrogenase formation chaperone [Paraburkholderia madseniana]NPT70144.1 HypC/HybG/HupF family hydrogenase formation chaperone [Paraburkholderia madseniana]